IKTATSQKPSILESMAFLLVAILLASEQFVFGQFTGLDERSVFNDLSRFVSRAWCHRTSILPTSA
ncbi:hypothetical protein AB4189_29165, partial [Vibrio sp. 10N.286.49.E1]|uniref:hypothetical protein n=1 Tax=Vibrio sp. 10N.286.49.E1 TaxID=3229702 RepID=UPI0035513CEC